MKDSSWARCNRRCGTVARACSPFKLPECHPFREPDPLPDHTLTFRAKGSATANSHPASSSS
ncbi:uncharacterized protein isoform X3 [Rhodnius prolixus]|uniref:uncharacterized protein isoform X3 n=1 Tax=Rhodnius prolixus TaxID=13249 RepID=UPI003D18B728